MTSIIKYSRVKSNVLAPVSLDPVKQHMSAWHLRQHHLIVNNARSREMAHVNPGRYVRQHKAQANKNESPSTPGTVQSQRFTLCNKMAPGCTYSKQSSQQTPKPLSWEAHAASHARQTAGQDDQPLFCPRILETKATSRLLQSRNYQQPRRKHRKHSAISQDREVASKVWRVPSSSSSSSGDSAYEAGGSSPPSRGSTPRTPQQDKRRDSSSAATSSVQSPVRGSSASSHTTSIMETPEQLPVPDLPSPSHIEPLPRNEHLAYAVFEHDLVNEILSSGLLTNAAMKQVCRTHVATHADSLQMDKMEEIVARLQQLLDIPNDNALDSSCFGLGSATPQSRLHSEESSAPSVPETLDKPLTNVPAENTPQSSEVVRVESPCDEELDTDFKFDADDS